MRIKSELLWGESIRNRNRVFDLLQAAKLPFGYYLLLCTENYELEIIPAGMQNNRYQNKKACLVFGIAYGKNEAQNMISDLLCRVFVKKQYASVKELCREIIEEPICSD